MGNVQEMKDLLAKQRRRYIVVIVAIAMVAVGFLAATVVLAIKLSGSYPSVKVTYHVWSHPNANVATKNWVELKVPENVTMFSVMEHAERESQQKFSFNFTQLSFGKYVTSIGGVQEDLAGQTYWILYKLIDKPNPGNTPTHEMAVEMGIDDIRVKDGDIYLFWLTKFDSYRRPSLIELGHVERAGSGPCQ